MRAISIIKYGFICMRCSDMIHDGYDVCAWFNQRVAEAIILRKHFKGDINSWKR
jgi:hypothetical protein